MADSDNKDFEHSMPMEESTLLDNKEADLENQRDQQEDEQDNEDERDNRAFISPPTPSPMNQKRPRPEPTPAQKAAEQELYKIRQQMYEQQRSRQAWLNPSRDMKRIQKMLNEKPAIRGALTQLYRTSPAAFLTLHPRQQLRIVKNVANHLKQISTQLVNPQQDPQFDLTKPLNMQNALSNGGTTASQNAAMQNGAVVAQNNEATAESSVEDQQQAAQQHGHDGRLVAIGAGVVAAFTLTKSDISEIIEHNKGYTAPTPKPGGSLVDEEDHVEAGTVIKHETAGAENSNAMKGGVAAVIDNDKAAFIASAKGVEKVVAPVVEAVSEFVPRAA